jgi:hypothetical protein
VKIARIRQDSPDRKQGIENIKEIILIVPGFIANFTKKSISVVSCRMQTQADCLN